MQHLPLSWEPRDGEVSFTSSLVSSLGFLVGQRMEAAKEENEGKVTLQYRNWGHFIFIPSQGYDFSQHV